MMQLELFERDERALLQEKRFAILAGKPIAYTLKRSPKRSTIGLKIDAKGLTVSVPQRASQKWLDSVLQDKAEWVLKHLGNINPNPSRKIIIKQGARLPFQGIDYTLIVEPSKETKRVEIIGSSIIAHISKPVSQKQLRNAVMEWYRHEAIKCFSERVNLYSNRLGVPVASLRLSDAGSRWGSCNSKGHIRLNWRLVTMPIRLIDYVVAHEVAHLVEMNHSSKFWDTVARIYPDYTHARRELRLVE